MSNVFNSKKSLNRSLLFPIQSWDLLFKENSMCTLSLKAIEVQLYDFWDSLA